MIMQLGMQQLQSQKSGNLSILCNYLSKATILPLVPRDESSSVETVFWADNFDTIAAQVESRGPVNTTQLMAFQKVTH